MSDIYQLYGALTPDWLNDAPSFEKRRRPSRCSAKASVRRGLCRAMRQSSANVILLAGSNRCSSDRSTVDRAA